MTEEEKQKIEYMEFDHNGLHFECYKDGRKLKRSCINCNVDDYQNCEDCCYEHTHKCAECNRSKGCSQFGCKYLVDFVKKE